MAAQAQRTVATEATAVLVAVAVLAHLLVLVRLVRVTTVARDMMLAPRSHAVVVAVVLVPRVVTAMSARMLLVSVVRVFRRRSTAPLQLVAAVAVVARRLVLPRAVVLVVAVTALLVQAALVVLVRRTLVVAAVVLMGLVAQVARVLLSSAISPIRAHGSLSRVGRSQRQARTRFIRSMTREVWWWHESRSTHTPVNSR